MDPSPPAADAPVDTDPNASASASAGADADADADADDRQQWSAALAQLARVRIETPAQQLARFRRARWVRRASFLLLLITAGAGVAVLVGGVTAGPADAVPEWQRRTGVLLALAGLVHQVGGLAMLVAFRAPVAVRRPLGLLSSAQCRELRAQVRGQHAVEPYRLPLARVRADQLVQAPNGLVQGAGWCVFFVGQWIAMPEAWRAWCILGLGLLVVGGWAFVQRDARRARRFLAGHPPAG